MIVETGTSQQPRNTYTVTGRRRKTGRFFKDEPHRREPRMSTARCYESAAGQLVPIELVALFRQVDPSSLASVAWAQTYHD